MSLSITTITRRVNGTNFKIIDVPISGCPTLTAPAFGTMNGTQGWLEGANVSFTCNPNTQMIGSAVRTCQPDRSWTGSQPVCGQ